MTVVQLEPINNAFPHLGLCFQLCAVRKLLLHLEGLELTVGVIQGLFVHEAFGYWPGCSWIRGGGECRL